MAADGHSLLDILDQSRSDHEVVDVLVTDLLMPTLNGVELIPAVKSRYTDLAVLVLSGSADSALVRQAILAGADGYVTKTADKTEFFDAILAVAAGRQYIDRRVFSMDDAAMTPPATNPLSARETEVAGLILDELTSTQIAERLFISFNTVETHRKRIYQKLGVTTSLGLLKHSFRQGKVNW